MNIILGLVLLLVSTVFLTRWIASRPRGIQLRALANISEGRWESGKWTALSDAVISSRFLLVKTGSDAAHINLCGIGDMPKGILIDEPGAIGAEVTVLLLGAELEEIPLVQASGAIAVDDLVVPDANGQVKTLPLSGGGTAFVVGKAFSAGSVAGDLIGIIPALPYAVTIPS